MLQLEDIVDRLELFNEKFADLMSTQNIYYYGISINI